MDFLVKWDCNFSLIFCRQNKQPFLLKFHINSRGLKSFATDGTFYLMGLKEVMSLILVIVLNLDFKKPPKVIRQISILYFKHPLKSKGRRRKKRSQCAKGRELSEEHIIFFFVLFLILSPQLPTINICINSLEMPMNLTSLSHTIYKIQPC